MWMEHKLGHRVNDLRMDEVQGLGPALLAVAGPFCLIMLDEAATETSLALQDIVEVNHPAASWGASWQIE